MTDLYGFIITRHVNNEKTNKYWNNCVKLIRTFYPQRRIIIIDDNSNYEYVKAEHEYKNLSIIQSEFPGRGELLPYYYLLKHKWFSNAIIIHDSVFIHKRINFERIINTGIKVLPLWHFYADKENIFNSKIISRYLKNNFLVENKLSISDTVMGLPIDKWYGCYGVQSVINLQFLEGIENKYKITNLLKAVKCRSDRCCLERIFGIMFCNECPFLIKQKSLLGDIMRYQTWGYTYDDYIGNLKQNKLPKLVVKVWTGR